MTRRAAAAAVLVLLAACDEGSIELGRGRDRPPGTFTFVEEGPGGDAGAGGAPADGGGGSPGADGGGSAPPDGEPSGPPGDGRSPGPDAPGGSGGSPAAPKPVPEPDDRGAIGSMGPALLRGDVPEVAVEIDASQGESLTPAARSALARQLERHGGKDVGFAAGSTVPAQDVYTTAELRSLMEAHRATWSTGRRAAVYVMVLSGRHEDEKVVGVSFNASSFAIFTEQLGGGLLGLNYASYEEAVVVHELGHLYGLVNLTGHGAFHEDPDHRGHSSSQGSVMFWAVESTVVGDVFEGGPPRDFDADDEREMAAIREA